MADLPFAFDAPVRFVVVAVAAPKLHQTASNPRPRGPSGAWLHNLFLDLATGTDAADPRQLTETLVLLYYGAVATAQMDKTPQAARTARRTAELILDNARHHSVEADAQAL